MNVQEKQTKKGISYKITYYINGKAHYTTLHDKKSVRSFAAQLELNKVNNSGLQTYSTEKLSSYYKKWIESKELNTEINTVNSYINSFKKLLPHLGHININSITSEQIQLALDKIKLQVIKDSKEKTNGNSTAQHCYVALKACMNQALKHRKIPYNPCNGVEKPKTNTQKKPLTKDEIFKVLEYTKNHKIYRFMALPFALGGFASLRRAEVAGLKWKNITEDLTSMTIDISVVNTQNKGNVQKSVKNTSSYREIPISSTIKELLILQKEHIEFLSKTFEDFAPSEFVCTNVHGVPLTPKYITTTATEILKILGLKEKAASNIKVTFHSSRHGFATILANDGTTNINTIKDLMGHADIRTTSETYITVENRSKQSAISSIDSRSDNTPK